jgi:hypothetical protein
MPLVDYQQRCGTGQGLSSGEMLEGNEHQWGIESFDVSASYFEWAFMGRGVYLYTCHRSSFRPSEH